MPENPGLAIKLYHWMRTVSETYQTTFETFVGCSNNYWLALKELIWIVQVLTKEASVFQIELYKNSKFDKFEVFLQISLGHYKSHRDDILLSSISYTQVLTFFKVNPFIKSFLIFTKEIFNMFNAGIAEEHSTSIAPKILAASVFSNISLYLQSFQSLLQRTRSKFNQLERFCSIYSSSFPLSQSRYSNIFHKQIYWTIPSYSSPYCLRNPNRPQYRTSFFILSHKFQLPKSP